MNEGLLKYTLDERVEAFTAGVNASLPYDVILGNQVHDIKVAVIKSKDPDPESLKGIDSLITDIKGVVIGVKTADCLPILILDPNRQVIAAVHAGWKGTARRIVCSTISQMMNEYHSMPEDMKVIIGPCISKDSFQVGEEVAMNFKDLGFPIDKVYSWNGPVVKGKCVTGHHIDLVAANVWLLEMSGVRKINIQICGIDTFTDNSFYSARRDGMDCGRNITAIQFKP